MGLFSRKGDFVDLTDMQKRGLLKEQVKNFETDSEGVVDLSSSNSSIVGSSNSEDSLGLGFLSGLASAGSKPVENSDSETGKYTNRLRIARANVTDISSLKIKVDDIEYKLERFLERLEKMEDKIRGSI